MTPTRSSREADVIAVAERIEILRSSLEIAVEKRIIMPGRSHATQGQDGGDSDRLCSTLKRELQLLTFSCFTASKSTDPYTCVLCEYLL